MIYFIKRVEISDVWIDLWWHGVRVTMPIMCSKLDRGNYSIISHKIKIIHATTQKTKKKEPK